MTMSMRYIGDMKIKSKIALLFVILTFALCSCGDSEPELYTEKKCFEYDLYFLEMNEESRFAITDFLIRNQNEYILGGTYSLYESKLVLISNHKDVKLVFVADGDNWVFDQEASEGLENLKFVIVGQSIWSPCNIFPHFK